MAKKAVNSEEAFAEAEFNNLFWAARKEHVRLRSNATDASPAHEAAVKFAKAHAWAWAQMLLEASRLTFAGKPARALSLLAEFESSASEGWRGVLHFLRGNALSARREHDEAIEAYRKSLADPKFDRWELAWHNLGDALYDKGDHDEAIKAYRRALEEPKNEAPGNSWNNLGNALSAKGEHDEAIKAYRRAIEDSKDHVDGLLWTNLGNAHSAKGDTGEAIKAYRRALQDSTYDSSGDLWNNLGTALSANGEHDEAINAYRRALEDPKNDMPGVSWNNLGGVHCAKGDYHEAIKAFRQALKDLKLDKPGDVWFNLGTVLSLNGEHDEAIEAHRKALEDPKLNMPADVWNNLGNALAATGSRGEAIEAYQKALEDPNFKWRAKTWTNLGQVYADAGERDRAERAFSEALKCVDPSGGDHARARFSLGMLKSKFEAKSLSPDDRAMLSKSISAVPAEEVEGDIIAAIREAGDTQYDKYLDERKYLNESNDFKRDNILSILRGWSSAITLLEGSERQWRGGGYFLKWRGHGIVIDPGFDFLRNFHDAGYHGCEIDAVIVSHNHPDHNSDVKGIDDLRYELFKRLATTTRRGSQPYVLVWDQDTDKATKFGFEAPRHQHEPVVMAAGFPQPIDLSKHAAKIPIRVVPFKVSHSPDVLHAMGMVIELLDHTGRTALRIGYTADTCYFSDLHRHLAGCDVLIAHISQPTIEELQDASKLKEMHLGYRGTAKLLGECKPTLALIGEFWAGFTDLRISLVKGLQHRSGAEQVLPTGLQMHIHLPSLHIECTKCKKPTPFGRVKVAPPTAQFGNLAYLCEKCMIG